MKNAPFLKGSVLHSNLIINSHTNTIAQQLTATPKRLTPKYANKIPIINDISPANKLSVVSIIAGKVITAKVI